MPLTKLDTITALIVIDPQKGIVGLPTVHPAGEVVKHASALAEAFRRHGLPVVAAHLSARRLSVGSLIRSARAGRLLWAPPRVLPRRLSGSFTSPSTIICACESTPDASASVSTNATLQLQPISARYELVHQVSDWWH